MLESDAQFWERHALIRELGRGCFGSVMLVEDRASAATVAVKVVDQLKEDGTDVHREHAILRAVAHRHVCELVAVYQAQSALFLVQRAEACDLAAHASSRPGGVLREAECRRHAEGLLRAVAHIHSLRVVHRDIKASNVLISHDGDALLSDFGLATWLPEQGLLTSVCGTHDYLAPEMISCGHGEAVGYGVEVDMWGMGLLLCDLLCACNPFERDTEIATLSAILSGRFEFPADRTLSASARHLIRRLLAVDPSSRLSAAEALDDGWLRGPIDVGSGLAAEPSAPATASQASWRNLGELAMWLVRPAFAAIG